MAWRSHASEPHTFRSFTVSVLVSDEIMFMNVWTLSISSAGLSLNELLYPAPFWNVT